MGIFIRQAEKTDAEAIGYVHYKAWIETYTGLLSDSFLASRSAEKSTALFRKTECKNVVVVCDGDRIVGFCGWGALRDSNADKKTGEIQGIYLMKSYQRMHLGQKMIEYAVNRLKSEGYEKIALWVLATNENAINFYEKLGFLHNGVSKDVDSIGSELMYVKNV